MEILTGILTAISPALVALIGIIPTIISNRKKTEKSIQDSNAVIKTELAKTQTALTTHIGEYEAAKAKTQRYRILRFYDELCAHDRHSESHFEDILDDIDEYERYCESHPEFRNNRGRVAMDYIKETYSKVKAKGGFLTHD